MCVTHRTLVKSPSSFPVVQPEAGDAYKWTGDWHHWTGKMQALLGKETSHTSIEPGNFPCHALA